MKTEITAAVGHIHFDLDLAFILIMHMSHIGCIDLNKITVGRKNGIIEILVNINQLFVAKIAHNIRQFLPPQKMVLLTADIDFCSFNEANN